MKPSSSAKSNLSRPKRKKDSAGKRLITAYFHASSKARSFNKLDESVTSTSLHNCSVRNGSSPDIFSKLIDNIGFNVGGKSLDSDTVNRRNNDDVLGDGVFSGNSERTVAKQALIFFQPLASNVQRIRSTAGSSVRCNVMIWPGQRGTQGHFPKLPTNYLVKGFSSMKLDLCFKKQYFVNSSKPILTLPRPLQRKPQDKPRLMKRSPFDQFIFDLKCEVFKEIVKVVHDIKMHHRLSEQNTYEKMYYEDQKYQNQFLSIFYGGPIPKPTLPLPPQRHPLIHLTLLDVERAAPFLSKQLLPKNRGSPLYEFLTTGRYKARHK